MDRVDLGSRLDLLLGDATGELLAEEIGVRTVGELLRHYPRSYAGFGALSSAAEPTPDTHVTIVAQVTSAELRPMKNQRGRHMLKVRLDDGRRIFHVTFFNGYKVQHHIKVGVRGLFSGTITRWRDQLQLTHPDYLLLPDTVSGTDAQTVELGAGAVRGAGRLADAAKALAEAGQTMSADELTGPMLPLYPATKNLQSWVILRCVRQVLDQLDPVADPLPAELVTARGAADLDTALRLIHRPETERDVERARERLRFDEAAALQLVLARRRRSNAERTAPACPRTGGGLLAAFTARLPFTLTAGQQEVGETFAAELARTRPMNRLLQGEVGSGKTIVAVLAMLQVIDAGHQCAILAPTEVLAAQHARSIREQLQDLATAGELGAPEHATRVTLLTGSMPAAAKKAALLEIVTGEAGIVVGTHALLQDRVDFHDLGLVVVDEQHRFGVDQRDVLRGKAREGITPHLLVMTATPIPRTIAMTVFGDLETSTLRELPAGRSPVTTTVVSMTRQPAWVARAWHRIVEEAADGHQAYIVCSRIGDEESAPAASGPGDGRSAGPVQKGTKKSGKKSGKIADDRPPDPTHAAVEVYNRLTAGALANLRVGLLHGRQHPGEKDQVMQQFAAGELDALVATTVIEVGVDVPGATVMVIMDADRFGISQLHQLRGRIGRGTLPGLCLLITSVAETSPAWQRLHAVAATRDGFELARLDLQVRAEGDVLGAAQSGRASSLRLLSLLDHEEVIAEARAFAEQTVAADPDLTGHPGLVEMVSAAEATAETDYLDKA